MNLDNLNRWLTFAANFGVFVGIVFLAVELRQNNELMESERRYNRLQVGTAINSTFIENPNLAEILIKATSGQEITGTERYLLDSHINNVFQIWQWYWLEVPPAEFPTSLISANFQNQFVVSRWESYKQLFIPEFVQFIEDNFISR